MAKQWQYVLASGYKALYISPEVAQKVIASLKAENCTIINENVTEIASVDAPGMCLLNRKYWSVEIDDLKIEIPMTDVADFLIQMRANRNLQKFVARGWYNVYGWRQCICLNKDQYDKLIELMEADSEINQHHAQFEHDRLAYALEKININLARNNVQFEMLNNFSEPLGGYWN
jgi:hypothetical protein